MKNPAALKAPVFVIYVSKTYVTTYGAHCLLVVKTFVGSARSIRLMGLLGGK